MLEYLGSKLLNINEEVKSDVQFYKINSQEKTEQAVNHHILLADVSGSMWRNLADLKKHIKLTLIALTEIENSYVSIITYSGHTQSKRVITACKCTEEEYVKEDINKVIDKEFYSKGVTIISEPLEDSITIVKSIASICQTHHIALFTDGCLVPTRWSEEKESEKCYEVAKICNQEGIVLNAIGFGQYYDREFLKKLIEIAGNGSVIHIDNIENYSKVILDAINKVNNNAGQVINLRALNGKIFVLANSMFKQDLNIVSSNNIIAVVGTNDGSVAWKISEEEQGSILGFGQDASDVLVEDFYYSLARYYLMEEDFDNFEFIMELIGDVALYEATDNCYSFLEKGNAVNKITEALNKPEKRFTGGKEPNIRSSQTDGLCLLQILKMIDDDEDSQLFWDLATPYHRITQKTKTTDDNIKFVANKEGYAPVSSITVGSKKLNIGIKVRIDGKSVDSVSGLEKNCCIYRDFNILNGGNVNVPYINARLSPDLYVKLFQYVSFHDIDNNMYMLNIENVKTANKTLLKSMSLTEIRDSMKEVAELKCYQWALGQQIKVVLGEKEKVDLMNFSFEEQEIRKLLRIDENNIYQPLSVEKDTDSAFEVYPAIHCEWNIAFSDKKVKEEKLKDLNGYVDSVTNVMNEEQIFEKLSKELIACRAKMRGLEFKVNCVRIASAMMKKNVFSWDVVLEKDKKTTDKTLNRNMVVGGKVKVSKKAVDSDMLEEKRWIELIKCN